jgi:hypothetical protein
MSIMSPLGPVSMETSLVSPSTALVPMSMESQQNHQQVSLSLLIEFLVQRVYHELTVLVRKIIFLSFNKSGIFWAKPVAVKNQWPVL